MVTIRALTRDEALAAVPQLSEVLIDCVRNGASVSFLPPLDGAQSEAFWRRVANSVRSEGTILLVAMAEGRIVGTVQVQPAGAPNQPHRADIAKMLVHSNFRRRGLGAALMQAAEAHALAVGKTLLVLDTQTGGDAERLYGSLGWHRVGEIPSFALLPNGTACATTFFYKRLR